VRDVGEVPRGTKALWVLGTSGSSRVIGVVSVGCAMMNRQGDQESVLIVVL